MRSVEVTTWYLRMSSPDDLRRPSAVPEGAELREASDCYPELAYLLYAAVGGDWYWVDRISWSYQRWERYLEDASVEVSIFYEHGTPAGYAELTGRPDGGIEIASFGLIPGFTGRGLGGWCLAMIAQRAWDRGARFVQVQTCSLDSPAALPNYEARGFTVFRKEREWKLLPTRPLGSWATLRHEARPLSDDEQVGV